MKNLYISNILMYYVRRFVILTITVPDLIQMTILNLKYDNTIFIFVRTGAEKDLSTEIIIKRGCMER